MGTSQRIIEIFISFLNQEKISSAELATKYQVNLRTAQRDIKAVRNAIEDSLGHHQHVEQEYVGGKPQYSVSQDAVLDAGHVYAVLKILMASRAFNKDEVNTINNALLRLVPSERRQQLDRGLKNELVYAAYISDGQDRVDKVGKLGDFVYKSTTIDFSYLSKEMSVHERPQRVTMLPVAVFFDNYYFFVAGLLANHKYQVFRVDWMDKIKVTQTEQIMPERAIRFEAGNKRRTTAFAYQGQPRTIKFEYYGYSEYVQDRFPGAKFTDLPDKHNVYDFPVKLCTINVEYSAGVEMWLLSQASIIKVVEPKEIADIMVTSMQTALGRYFE